MTHRNKIAGLITLALLSVSTYAWSADYSTMSTQELSHLRGTMQSASQADRDAFDAEWRHRVERMTPAERQQYMDHAMDMNTTDNSGHTGNMGNGNHSKGGNGMGNSGGMGGGNGSGSGMGGGGGMGHGGGGGMGGGMGH